MKKYYYGAGHTPAHVSAQFHLYRCAKQANCSLFLVFLSNFSYFMQSCVYQGAGAAAHLCSPCGMRWAHNNNDNPMHLSLKAGQYEMNRSYDGKFVISLAFALPSHRIYYTAFCLVFQQFFEYFNHFFIKTSNYSNWANHFGLIRRK